MHECIKVSIKNWNYWKQAIFKLRWWRNRRDRKI